jgi:hypothetical protein
MSEGAQGRYILATLDKTTGTHTLHNWPTKSYSDCVAVAKSMGPFAESTHRLIFKSHDDSGEP